MQQVEKKVGGGEGRGARDGYDIFYESDVVDDE